MITKIFLLAGFGALSCGYYFLKKARNLNDLFRDVKNVQLYNLDYLDKIIDLPIDRNILLLGIVKPHDYVIQDSEGKDCVLKTISREMPQGQSPDHFWSTDQSFRCFLANSKDEGIYIENQSPNTMLAFNLKTVGRIDKSKLKLSLLSRISSLLQKTQFEQKSIRVDSNMVAIGRLIKSKSQNQTIHYMMKPKFIMADNKQALLKYLDLKIVELNKKANIFAGIGTLVLVSHFAYTHWTRKQAQLPEPE